MFELKQGLLTGLIGFILLSIVIIGHGCGKRQTVIYDQPEVSTQGYYEKAWIDPQILSSDSLYTLISARRIDSFYVDEPLNPLEPMAPAIEFHIDQGGCFVSINLLDERSAVIRPLVVRRLGYGYYKITVNVAKISPGLSSAGICFLKAEYCGFTVVERLTVR
ncbi:MAG: hypothetical protein AB1483_04105 [Candidatus Zixiibacteriota bacterium]